MQRFIEKTGFCPAPWQKQFSFTEYSKCCVVIENTSFRHSDVHQFCLTLPGGTWGEIKTYIQYKIWSLFNALKDRNNLWALPGWSYGPSSLSHHFSVLICREASADTCGGGGGLGHNASSPASSLPSTVEAGVGATAAFLVSGRGLCNTHR